MMIVLMTMSGTAVNKLRVSWGCALDHLAALRVCSTLEHGVAVLALPRRGGHQGSTFVLG
jgi:hypothetical protein